MELPKRKKLRLACYDYAHNGAYFVTIRISNPTISLWEVNAGPDSNPPPLSQHGILIERAVHALSEHYPHIHVDKYCLMPDHLHMIVFMESNGQTPHTPTLSTIIGQMKRWVSKQIGDSVWQKSFHDRVIRNEKEYEEVWQYIDENPLQRCSGANYLSHVARIICHA